MSRFQPDNDFHSIRLIETKRISVHSDLAGINLPLITGIVEITPPIEGSDRQFVIGVGDNDNAACEDALSRAQMMIDNKKMI